MITTTHDVCKIKEIAAEMLFNSNLFFVIVLFISTEMVRKVKINQLLILLKCYVWSISCKRVYKDQYWYLISLI